MPASFELKTDLGDAGENPAEATIRITGSEERIRDLLSRLHPFISNERARILAERSAGISVPCQGCGHD